jgi:hypothetical protein
MCWKEVFLSRILADRSVAGEGEGDGEIEGKRELSFQASGGSEGLLSEPELLQAVRGVNPVLQVIFTFAQMYFVFMNSRVRKAAG